MDVEKEIKKDRYGCRKRDRGIEREIGGPRERSIEVQKQRKISRDRGKGRQIEEKKNRERCRKKD